MRTKSQGTLPLPLGLRLLAVTLVVVSLTLSATTTTTSAAPLRSPVLLTPSPTSNNVLEVELTLRQSSVDLDTVASGPVGNFILFGYKVVRGQANGGPSEDARGTYPGPTLNVQPGQTLIMTINNALTNLTMRDYFDPHWTPVHATVPLYPAQLTTSPYNNHVHGIHTSPAGNSDNVLLSIPPGTMNTYTYYIPTDHPAGMYWYHTHRHMLTSPQTFRGLAGMLIIGRADGYIPAVSQNKLPIRVMALQYNTVFDRASATKRRRVLNNPYWNSGINTSVVPAPGELAKGTYRPLLTPINFQDSDVGTSFLTAWWAGALSVNNNRGKYQWMPQSLQTFTNAKGVVTQRAQPNADPRTRDVQFTVNGQFQPTVDDTVRGQTEVWVLANMADAAYMVVTLTETATGNHPVISIIGQDGNPRDVVGVSFLDGGRRLVLPPATRYAIAVTMPLQGDLVLEMPPVLPKDRVLLQGQLKNPGIRYVNDGTPNPPAELGTISVDARHVNYMDGFFVTPTQVLLTARPDATKPATKPVPFKPGQPTNAYSSFYQTVGKPVAATRSLIITGGFGNEWANPQDPNAFAYQFDGNQFPNIPLLQPRLNTIEEWRFLNFNNDEHPIHIHINDFQVTEIVDPQAAQTGGRVVTGPGNWGQDNINVPAPLVTNKGKTIPGEVTVRTFFQQYAGTYVFHCHRLNHEDNGLMAVVNVIPQRSVVAIAYRTSTAAKVDVVSTGDAPFVQGDSSTDTVASGLVPFSGYAGTLVTAVADVDGDGVFDLVVATTADVRPRIMAFAGATNFSTVLVKPFFLTKKRLPRAAAVSVGAGGYVLGFNTSAQSNVVVGINGRVVVLDLMRQSAVSSFAPFGNAYAGAISVAVGQVTGLGRTGIVVGSLSGDVAVFVFQLYVPVRSAKAPSPSLVARFSPFGALGADAKQPVGLAAGWVAGLEGGFARIVVSHPTLNRVKVFTVSSRVQGHPELYIVSLMDYSVAENYVEMADFAVANVPSGKAVAVATASNIAGASLVVASTSTDIGALGGPVVRLTELVRPSRNATMVEPDPAGYRTVWVAPSSLVGGGLVSVSGA